MRDGILTAIFPIGMKVMDIVFYQYDKDNLFHNSTYHRAGISNKGKKNEMRNLRK